MKFLDDVSALILDLPMLQRLNGLVARTCKAAGHENFRLAILPETGEIYIVSEDNIQYTRF